ncbi:Methyltransferase type 11 [Gloeothece citriformis PCC 7424]|uniref:Methyltransferase type 11 n=1 Tax=Gloeothece citriformis (strain PCC 7424) TaxID=65393 RepID=B7KIG1_GLOC7|nr:class I SAM-dependent methyltransferase [Gloeothece citriformis]ACK69367.1 Methyltransferase type 11 [Gloeothece citriformis PCC 7424]
MKTYFDPIVLPYQKFHDTPQSKYIDSYTFLKLVGNVENKSLLDLGCGGGFYTRIFREQGANPVVGVDISEKMLEFAQEKEAQHPLGIQYLLKDVTELEQIGHFDLVISSYLLNDFSTPEQLLKIAQISSNNLKEGGRFIGINENVQQLPETYSVCRQYGYTKELLGDFVEGVQIRVTYPVPSETLPLIFQNYYLSRKTYESAFRQSGFKKFIWYPPQVSPEGQQKLGWEYWQDFVKYELIVGIVAIK